VNSSCYFFRTIHLAQAKKWQGENIAAAVLLQAMDCSASLGIGQDSRVKERRAERQDEHFDNYSCCPTVQQCKKKQPGVCYSITCLSGSFKSHPDSERGCEGCSISRCRSTLQGQSLMAQTQGDTSHCLSGAFGMAS